MCVPVIGFFHTPKLLISTAEKVAIEGEILGLGEFFGNEKWRDTPLERPEEFAGILVNREDAVDQLFSRLAEMLGLNSERVRLLYSRSELNSVSGLGLIHSHEHSLDEDGVVVPDFQSDLVIGANLRFDSLLGEMVRKLVTLKLIQSGYIDAGSSDIDLIAEVATVFFGFGLFTVNETVSTSQSSESGFHHYSMVKLGALNSFGIGYLMALVLWHRNQTNLDVEKYLRLDACLSFQKTIEYLTRTNDSLLADPNLARMDSSTSISTIEAQLKSCTPTGALWLLESIQFRTDLKRDIGLVQSTLFEFARSRDLSVARMALHLISFAPSIDSIEVRQLKKMSRSRDPWVSAVAANILSAHLPFEKCEHEFRSLLDRTDHDAAANAAQMAHRFQSRAVRYEQQVCQRIKMAINRVNYGLGFWYMLVLTQISEDPVSRIEEVFGADEELFRGASELFREVSDSTEIRFDEPEFRPDQINDIFAIPAWMSI